MRKRWNILGRETLAKVLIAILAISLILNVYLASDYLKKARLTLPYPLNSTEGYVEADISVHGSTILLASECYRMAVDIAPEQAYSIDKGIKGTVDFRPTSHDVMADAFGFLEIGVVMVKIDRFEEGIFYSRLIIRQGDTILDLDSRPSDAIAVAVRMKAPIYIKNQIIEENGENVC